MHPGGKLLFMGNEIGQYDEWNFKQSIQWNLLEFETHKGVQNVVRDLNALYKTEPALHKIQFDSRTFEWIDFSDHEKSILSFLRKSEDIDDTLLVICNFTPEIWKNYGVGVPAKGDWNVVFNSDSKNYFGSDYQLASSYTAKKVTHHGRVFSIEIDIPPLAVVVLKLKG